MGPRINSLEQHIRQSLLEYPSIFPHRTEVLHHLFFVLGNGYEWRGGKLAHWDEDDETDSEAALEREVALQEVAQMSPEERQELLAETLESLRPRRREILFDEDDSSFKEFVDRCMYRSRLRQFYRATEEIEERCRHRAKLTWVYPSSPGSSKFFTMPKDVDPDWLAGALEAAEDYLEKEHNEEISKRLEALKGGKS